MGKQLPQNPLWVYNPMQYQSVTVSKLAEGFDSTSTVTLRDSFSGEVLYGNYQCRGAGCKKNKAFNGGSYDNIKKFTDCSIK